MEQKPTWLGVVFRGDLTRCNEVGSSRRRAVGSVIGLGLGVVGPLIVVGHGVAQVPAHARLTDPRTLAVAVRTEQAGEFALDSLDYYRVSIPEQCVGTRRCPLLVILPTNGMMDVVHPAANENGVIVLNVGRDHGEPSVRELEEYFGREERHPALEQLDVALKQVFRRFAIDLDKIALMGRCATGPTTSFWGRHNPHVFNRIVLNSSGWRSRPAEPQNKTTEVLNVGGLQEPAFAVIATEVTQTLQRDGHRTRLAIGFRGHEHQWEDYYFITRWLQESWATPNPAARPAPPVVADPLPVLTAETLTRMTAFWTSFMQEPDSIKTIARRAHLRMVALPVGTPSPWIGMVDMAALAARYPSVAAALKVAGLTAQQHEAYRVALASARFVDGTQADPGPLWAEVLTKSLAANPVLAQNVEFVRTHPDDLAALEDTRMWQTP